MDVEQMRCLISKVYEGPKWRDKVKHMPDNQVIAIYYKFAKSGKLDKKNKSTTKQCKLKQIIEEEEGCFAEQLSFDF